MARPRDPAIDRAVVRACVELLGETGRSGLSRARVAERAGVSLPAVTRRYRSVDDVLVAVARQPGTTDVADLTAPTSLRTFLTRTLRAQARAFTDPRVRRAAAELLAAAAGNPEIDRAFGETLAAQRAEGLRWVEHARAEGSIRADASAELILDMVTGSAYYRLLWRGEPLDEHDVDRVVDQALLGVAPPRGARAPSRDRS